jgi:hypothetical protein
MDWRRNRTLTREERRAAVATGEPDLAVVPVPAGKPGSRPTYSGEMLP